MPITNQSRSKRRQEPALFQSPTDRSTWDRLPQQVRQEVQRLLAQMLIAMTVAGTRAPERKEDDHE
jgi:hypothetical protein